MKNSRKILMLHNRCALMKSRLFFKTKIKTKTLISRTSPRL